MPKDTCNAVWVSYSSISDFLACPRAYFLKNVYKDPKRGNKISVMMPPLALGQAVHSVLDSLSVLKKDERFSTPLPTRFKEAWSKVSGKKGGFFDDATETTYRKRGETMMERVYNHPGPLKELAVKIKDDLPHFWLSDDDDIILCGKLDWLQYDLRADSVHIIDFKTGKKKEDETSLQLPIYYLLTKHCQTRDISGMSYWYLESDNALTEAPLPEEKDAHKRILEIAQKIKLARQLNKFDCSEDGCRTCSPIERVLSGEGEHVGQDTFGADVYILPSDDVTQVEEIIL